MMIVRVLWTAAVFIAGFEIGAWCNPTVVRHQAPMQFVLVPE